MDDLIQKVVSQVKTEMQDASPSQPAKFPNVGVTEFVGTAMGPTIGLVLASIDADLADKLELGHYRSIGFLGSRQGFNPQAFALDDAVKATNVEMLKVESPRDDMGGDGASSYFVIGADDVSDVKRCIEIALNGVEKYYGGIWANEYGHLDMQWSSRAGECLNMAFGVEVGKSIGVINAGPTPVGAILSDIAVKSGNVDIVSYTSCSSGSGFAFANEFTMTITGDSGAVRQAVKSTIEPGRKILAGMGGNASCMGVPYY